MPVKIVTHPNDVTDLIIDDTTYRLKKLYRTDEPRLCMVSLITTVQHHDDGEVYGEKGKTQADFAVSLVTPAGEVALDANDYTVSFHQAMVPALREFARLGTDSWNDRADIRLTPDYVHVPILAGRLSASVVQAQQDPADV